VINSKKASGNSGAFLFTLGALGAVAAFRPLEASTGAGFLIVSLIYAGKKRAGFLRPKPHEKAPYYQRALWKWPDLNQRLCDCTHGGGTSSKKAAHFHVPRHFRGRLPLRAAGAFEALWRVWVSNPPDVMVATNMLYTACTRQLDCFATTPFHALQIAGTANTG